MHYPMLLKFVTLMRCGSTEPASWLGLKLRKTDTEWVDFMWQCSANCHPFYLRKLPSRKLFAFYSIDITSQLRLMWIHSQKLPNDIAPHIPQRVSAIRINYTSNTVGMYWLITRRQWRHKPIEVRRSGCAIADHWRNYKAKKAVLASRAKL